MASVDKDRTIIRDLGKRVAEIAALPVQHDKKEAWIRLNRLERVRPTVHVQALPLSLWAELLPEESLQCVDPFCRQQEWALRKIIYCWERFPDDRVIDDVVACPIRRSGAGWDIERNWEIPGLRFGAKAYQAVIEEEKDIEKIKTSPIVVDWEGTERNYQQLSELYDGVLRVEKRGPSFHWFNPMDEFIRWRGIERMFMDLMERPEWIHQALERLTAGTISQLEQMEELGLLSPGHGNQMLGSGGYGFTDQLPQPDFDGEHVRLKDLWARASTQIFTESVSAEMHDEFAIQYERRVLERFGLSCYGCCEPLHNKMHIVRRIKNLRRVSMSPWVDIAKAAEEVGKDYVYTHKPNPAHLSSPQWDLDMNRSKLREALEKTRENVVEINLQDLHTLQNEPRRITEWTRMALELAEEYA